ncbi:MAG: TolC family protein [Phycisphaerales bacterium]|nr:TolC family protein [Phycisphaerales bacterium]
MQYIPTPRSLMLGLVLVILSGCQTYQPRPLDPQSHLEAFSARSVHDQSLKTFIDSLDNPSQNNRAIDSSPYDPSDGISLNEAERIALYYNPDLRIARLQAGLASADATHAGIWDDPSLNFDALRITDGGNTPWIIGGSLSITIPISGRLRTERARADAQTKASLSAIAQAEWNTRIELRRVWNQWSAAHLRAQRNEHLLESIIGLASSTTKLAQAGELPSTQALLFEIERVSHIQSIARHRVQATMLKHKLHAIMGLPSEAEVELTPAISTDPVASPPRFEHIVEHHPSLLQLRDEYAISEASLLHEIRKQYPDLTIGPAYESEQGESRIGLVAGIPLPILNSNKQGIARARAQRELARGVYETQLERHRSALAVALLNANSAQRQRTQMESTLVPLVDKQLTDAQRLLELGESDGLVLLESLQRAGQTTNEIIDARLAEAMATTELEALIGLIPSTQLPPSTHAQPINNPTTPEGTE